MRRLQIQRLGREIEWEGYAALRDRQFVGIVNHATAANRCTRAARED
ncbi:MAG: hypothetical protein KJZ75_11085 [Hyphomonadaceae bacterium]|nr:hypothetical protein [Hyphomonadaceae bacterium]